MLSKGHLAKMFTNKQPRCVIEACHYKSGAPPELSNLWPQLPVTTLACLSCTAAVIRLPFKAGCDLSIYQFRFQNPTKAINEGQSETCLQT